MPDRPVDPSFAVVDPLGSIDHRPVEVVELGVAKKQRPNVGGTPGMGLLGS